MRIHGLLASVILLASCGGSSEPMTATVPPPAAAPAAEAAGARDIDLTESGAMLDVLRADTSSARDVWIVVSPGNADTARLAGTLETVLREGGFTPTTLRLTGMVLKPGPIRILVGEEVEPPTVDTVRRALEAGGLTVETGTGYRAYYEEKKRENPNWPGIPLGAEQAFVLVVSPPPA